MAGRGHSIVVIDNLAAGFKDSLLHQERLAQVDLADSAAVERVFEQTRPEAVMHFAAATSVPESVSHPLKYYETNTANTLRLLHICVQHGVKYFVFSGTAAVYGLPDAGVASEQTPMNPINPYGSSKLMSEWMLRDVSRAGALKYVSLRYFNVAGADPKGRIGQSTLGTTLLTKVVCEAGVGLRSEVEMFGTDYNTEDGTAIRDYIHVWDLADAHVLALNYLAEGGESDVFNVGYGKGYSVSQVLSVAQKIMGTTLKVTPRPRRAGDPPKLIADATKVRKVLGWTPQYESLETVYTHAWQWERKLKTLRSQGLWSVLK
jgi:UDP-glucose 4-epimerase